MEIKCILLIIKFNSFLIQFCKKLIQKIIYIFSGGAMNALAWKMPVL